MAVPTAPLAAAGLLGGYAAARYSGNRPVGGIVLGAAGVACSREWLRSAGPGVTAGLLGIYLGGFGASHPLAKQIGAWPAVLTVTTVSAIASHALADRSTSH